MSRVDTENRGDERYSEDDGLFDGGDVGGDYYRRTFEGRAGDNSHEDSRNDASRRLNDAEKGAVADGRNDRTKKEDSGKEVENQRKKEESVAGGSNSSGFNNKVTGNKDDGKKKKGFFKKKGPLMAIFLMMCGIGGTSYLSQATMPFSLISQFQTNFDSIGTSTNLRTKKFIKLQMDGGRVKTCTKSTIFGNTKFKVSSRQQAKLEKYGITMDVDSDGAKVMKFTQSDGTERIIKAADFDAEYHSNPEFHDAYYSGSRTWRGAVSDWFDSMATKFFNFLGIDRNNFKGFKKSGDQDADQANFKKTVNDVADSDSLSGNSKSTTPEDYDSDGDGDMDSTRVKTDDDSLNVKRSDVPKDASGDYDSTRSAGSEVEAEVSRFTRSKMGKAAGWANAAVNVTCGVFNTLGAISMIVVAYQSMQIIKTASTIFEGIQKGQIDDSMGSPINEISNSLTKRTEHTYTDADTKEVITRSRSAMEADSVGAIYGNTAVNRNDVSVKSFNIMSVLKSLGAALSLGVSSFQACAYAKVAANAVDTVMDIVDVVICIVSFGIGCLVDAMLDISAVQVAVTMAISILVPLAVPMIAQVLTRKIATEVMGEDLGNALVSGANMYMGQNHQYSGGSVASKDTFLQYITARDKVIAEQAEYERRTRSPFDVTSQYTFMGSLLEKIRPLAIQASSLTSGVSSFMRIVSSATTSLLPTASAITAANTAQIAADQTANNCPYLESIGAVGDAFCNPYFITDVNTIEQDPADVVNKVQQLGGFENNDEEVVPTIKKDSDLAKYIVYCGQRQSQFGLPDQNIASSVQSASTGNNILDAGIGLIPIVGDVVDLVNNTEVVVYYGYVNGEACVTGNDRAAGAAYADWDDNKYYQRFIEDQRLAENMGLVEESAVSIFLEEYYKEHPLDNSFEGMLARYSGLTKENVEIALADMEFLLFLANYDPSELYPILPPKEKKAQQKQIAEDLPYKKLILQTDYKSDFKEERYIRNFAI